jgi:hypothetical protein
MAIKAAINRHAIVIAGDTSYNESLMLAGTVDG